MISIFSWYMTKKFFKPFFFGLGLFAILIFLGDMFDHMNKLVSSQASLGVVLQYLFLDVPYWGVRSIPMATLLATLVAITGFVQSGEWLAAQACGFETRTFWMPLLWCALAVTALSFVTQETLLPVCFHKARQIWREKIHPELEWEFYDDIALVAGPRRFISAKKLAMSQGRLERPMLDEFDTKGVTSQLDARGAQWDPAARRWIFEDGVERRFAGGRIVETAFSRKISEFDVPPRSLIPETTNPDEMSFGELMIYIRQMRRLGAPVAVLKLAAHAKAAYPFANLVICALGIPIALRLRRSPRVVSFCLALALSFFYLWVIELGKALGTSERLPPALAAWSANFVFAGLAVWLMRRWEAA